LKEKAGAMMTTEEARVILMEELLAENYKLKKLNELWQERFINMEILYKNAKGEFLND
jgi:FtsZ-binding cell division protein ZapB